MGQIWIGGEEQRARILYVSEGMCEHLYASVCLPVHAQENVETG